MIIPDYIGEDGNRDRAGDNRDGRKLEQLGVCFGARWCRPAGCGKEGHLIGSGLCTWTAGDVAEMGKRWGRHRDGCGRTSRVCIDRVNLEVPGGPPRGGVWEAARYVSLELNTLGAVITGQPSQNTHPSCTPASRRLPNTGGSANNIFFYVMGFRHMLPNSRTHKHYYHC